MIKTKSLLLPILACLTLGLAPFRPEPHLLGKLRWVAGGGIGMQPIDYLDLLLHGAPLIILILLLVRNSIPSNRGQKR